MISKAVGSLILFSNMSATHEQSKESLDAEKQKVIQSLEEDDEFEDFKAEGKYPVTRFKLIELNINMMIDWPEEQSLGAEGEKSLWVEDWDDNDADDNFTSELK